MNKAHENKNWEDFPSENTPLNAKGLNDLDRSVDVIDNRVIHLDTTKFDKIEAQELIKDVTFDLQTGILTKYYYNGSKEEINTGLSKLNLNLRFDKENQILYIVNADGTEDPVDLSSFITNNEFANSDTIAHNVSANGMVTSIVKDGSIQEKHLRPDYLANIKVESANAVESQQASAQSAEEAATSAVEAESYAHGGTGAREGEDTDNAKYYMEQAKLVANVDIMTGATSDADGKSGLVPKPLISDKDSFLKGNGTWGKAGTALHYDEENSELQLKSGETVLSTVTIEGGVSASQITVKTSSPEYVGKNVSLHLDGSLVETKTFDDTMTVIFKVKLLGTYTVQCEDASAAVNVTQFGSAYSATVDSNYAIINISTTSSELFGVQISIKKSNGSIAANAVFSQSGAASANVKEIDTYTVACTFDGKEYSNTVDVTALEKTSYSVSLSVPKSIISVTTSSVELQNQTVSLMLNNIEKQSKAFSPDNVAFTVYDAGVYTLVCGEYSETVNVSALGSDYAVSLNTIPDGATVEPINDVPIWLKCAGLMNTGYTTLDQVLADTTTLGSLTMDENAMKYLARSEGFADTLCANETFMTYLGQSPYVDDTVLNCSSWRQKCLDSPYYQLIFLDMIKIEDLPVGTLIQDTDTTYLGSTIVWKKMESDHEGDPANSTALITDKIITFKCFDAKEPSNPDSNRKQYGNDRWLYSNIKQWLNSDAPAGEWYTAQHSYDAPPINANLDENYNEYDQEAGFLTNFSANMKAALMTVTKRVAKNTVTDGGGYEDVAQKIFLLSTTEVGLENANNIAEGSIYELFNTSSNRIAYPTAEAVANSEFKDESVTTSKPWYWWLRTLYVLQSYAPRYVGTNGSLYRREASSAYGVRPAFVLSSNTLVSKTPVDGVYQVVWE